ncbi:MAG: cytidine deaminase [Bacillota bacterium]|nr:cytidine deaminase [Bacillota bacterium]
MSENVTVIDVAHTQRSDIEDMLVQAARSARQNAYVPYSGFRVGAAVLADSGRIYAGCNVENASFGATICAERTAFVKAISEGERRFLGVAVCGASPEPVSPCGICRQFMAEFGLDMPVIMAGEGDARTIMTLRELLPLAFTSEDME